MAEPLDIVVSAIDACDQTFAFIRRVDVSNGKRSSGRGDTVELAHYLEILDAVINSAMLSVEGTVYAAGGTNVACAKVLRRLRRKMPSPNQSGGTSCSYHDSIQHDLHPYCRNIVKDLNDELGIALRDLRLIHQKQIKATPHESDWVFLDAEIKGSDASSLRPHTRSRGEDTKSIPTDVCVLMEQMTSLTRSFMRLESRVSYTFPDAYSVFNIQRDIVRLHKLHYRFNRICWRLRRALQPHYRLPYDYPGHKSLLSVGQDIYFEHIKETPTLISSTTQLLFQLLFQHLTSCTSLLKTKIDLAIQWHHGIGIFSIARILRTFRLVERSSVAFQLIANFPKYAENPTSARQYIRILERFFVERRATPYDRLTDGSTLLHALCNGINEYLFDSPDDRPPPAIIESCESPFADLITFLIGMMGDLSLELDDSGRAALDRFCRPSRILMLNTDNQTDIDELGISSSEATVYRTTISSLVRRDIIDKIDFHTDVILSVLTRSQPNLRDAISHEPDSIRSFLLLGLPILESLTSLGWLEGCQVLLDHGVEITSVGQYMIIHALNSGDARMLRFWLKRKRKTADEHERTGIGNVEMDLSRHELDEDMLTILVEELVAQRQRLKALATQLTDAAGMKKQKPKDLRILDASAKPAFEKLKQNPGIEIDTSLRPAQASVYHTSNPLPTSHAEILYHAGFHDVTQADFSHIGKPISPLVWNAVYIRDTSMLKALILCTWFVQKGAKLTETWPGTNIAAWKLLGYQSGRWIANRMDTYSPTSQQLAVQEAFILPLLASSYVDECVCPCSSGGCSALSSFIRAATELRSTRLSRRHLLFVLTSWVAPIARSYRYFVTALLRSLTFWQLGLSHTCCNVSTLAKPRARAENHWKAESCGFSPLTPNSTIASFMSPISRRGNPHDDKHTLRRLEHLVDTFSRAYDAMGKDIVTFIMGHWSSIMLIELQRQAEQDRETSRYGDQRRDFHPLKTGLLGEVNLDEYTFWDERLWAVPTMTVRELMPRVKRMHELEDAFVFDDAEGEVIEDFLDDNFFSDLQHQEPQNEERKKDVTEVIPWDELV